MLKSFLGLGGKDAKDSKEQKPTSSDSAPSAAEPSATEESKAAEQSEVKDPAVEDKPAESTIVPEPKVEESTHAEAKQAEAEPAKSVEESTGAEEVTESVQEEAKLVEAVEAPTEAATEAPVEAAKAPTEVDTAEPEETTAPAEKSAAQAKAEGEEPTDAEERLEWAAEETTEATPTGAGAPEDVTEDKEEADGAEDDGDEKDGDADDADGEGKDGKEKKQLTPEEKAEREKAREERRKKREQVKKEKEAKKKERREKEKAEKDAKKAAKAAEKKAKTDEDAKAVVAEGGKATETKEERGERGERGGKSAARVRDFNGFRVLFLSNLQGQLRSINDAVDEHGANAVVCCGNFGFYDRESARTLPIEDLRTYLQNSNMKVKQTLLSYDDNKLREVMDKRGLSDLPSFMTGEHWFRVPVYAIYGAEEDVRVVRRFVEEDARVRNLHVINESKSFLINNTIRVFGMGGGYVMTSLFDMGLDSDSSDVAGHGGQLWVTMWQLGELNNVALKSLNIARETRVFVSNITPAENPIAYQICHALKADYSVSPALRSSKVPSVFDDSTMKEPIAMAVNDAKAELYAIFTQVEREYEAVCSPKEIALIKNARNLLEMEVIHHRAYRATLQLTASDARNGSLMMVQNGKLVNIRCHTERIIGANRPESSRDELSSKPKVFMKGLPDNVTESSLSRFLQGIAIRDIFIHRDQNKQAKGMATITVATQEDARKACQLSQRQMGDRYVTVEPFKPLEGGHGGRGGRGSNVRGGRIALRGNRGTRRGRSGHDGDSKSVPQPAPSA
eukprot:Clim_evm77s108 gene=Clim_evmTU77s108